MIARKSVLTAAAATGLAALIASTGVASASDKVEAFAPGRHDNAGIEGKGWFVDLAITYPGASLSTAGLTGLQPTGPAGHNNIPPFPGAF